MLWTATDPGFTDEFFQKMLKRFIANLDIDEKGGVVAAPDYDTPGGSYYYHWMRDAALSMRAYMEIHDLNY